MFELTQMASNKNFRQRVFPVLLPDAAILKTRDRLKYTRYWEDEKKALETELKEVSTVSSESDSDIKASQSFFDGVDRR
jgi:hypothetical protein